MSIAAGRGAAAGAAGPPPASGTPPPRSRGGSPTVVPSARALWSAALSQPAICAAVGAPRKRYTIPRGTPGGGGHLVADHRTPTMSGLVSAYDSSYVSSSGVVTRKSVADNPTEPTT
eukprot:2002772-Pyramimonas_sp.AAC.1